MKKKAEATSKFLDNIWNVAVLVAVTFAAIAVVFKIDTPQTVAYVAGAILAAEVLFKVYRLQSK